MSKRNKLIFHSRNKCRIWGKLFDVGDNKVRDHCHVKDNWSCNINLRLTKKVPVTFYNLIDYGSHLIMQEIYKFNVAVSVIQKIL